MALEKPSDLTNEETMEAHLAEYLSWKMVKLAKFHMMDRVIVGRDSEGDHVRGWVELKWRTCPSTTYPTVMAAVEKTVFSYSLAEKSGLPYWFVVSYADVPDRSYWICRITEDILKGRIANTGRTDRGREHDIQPMYLIPLDLFTRVGPQPTGYEDVGEWRPSPDQEQGEFTF